MPPPSQACPACGAALRAAGADPSKRVCAGCGAKYVVRMKAAPAAAQDLPKRPSAPVLKTPNPARRQASTRAKPSRVSLWAALIGGAAAILLVLLAAAGLAIRFWPRQAPPPTPVAVTGDTPTPPASTADASPPKDAVPPTDVQAPAPTKANPPPEPPAPTPPTKTPAPTPPEPPAPTPPPIKSPPASPPAVTGSHWVVLTDAHQYWYDDEAHPACKKLKELSDREKQELRCIAFTPGGDWVILDGSQGFFAGDPELPFCKKLTELAKQHSLKWIAFAPSGGWVVFYDQNGWAGRGIPADAQEKIVEIAKAGGTLRSITFTNNEGWVVLFDESGVAMGGHPKNVEDPLAKAADKQLPVRCLVVAPLGNWLMQAGDTWQCQYRTDPMPEQLDALVRAGEAVRCVAYVPSKYIVEVKPARRVKGVLTTDVTLPGGVAEEWLLYAPKAPTCPGQQDVETTFSPDAKVVKELSLLERPVFQSLVIGRSTEAHAKLTIEATLNSRRLRLLAPGEDAPKSKTSTRTR